MDKAWKTRPGATANRKNCGKFRDFCNATPESPCYTTIMKSEYVVVGGGLVGLSTAYQLLRAKPGASVCVLEKEAMVATHQSTRNSGVIHTGVYYTPNSFKARLCVEGRRALLDFAEEHRVPHSICGKVIVATSDTSSTAPVFTPIASRANSEIGQRAESFHSGGNTMCFENQLESCATPLYIPLRILGCLSSVFILPNASTAPSSAAPMPSSLSLEKAIRGESSTPEMYYA